MGFAGTLVSKHHVVLLQDPMKPCVKGHHSVVLRAETAAEKSSWLARLRYASDGSSKNQPIKKYRSKGNLAQTRDGSKTDGKEQSRQDQRGGALSGESICSQPICFTFSPTSPASPSTADLPRSHHPHPLPLSCLSVCQTAL